MMPGRKPLVTLRDAAKYVATLFKAAHDPRLSTTPWRTGCWRAGEDETKNRQVIVMPINLR